MTEEIQNKEIQKEEVVKRPRGRPKKNSPPVVNPLKILPFFRI